MLLAAGLPLEQIQPEPVVQLGGGDGPVEAGPHQEITHVRVGLEQNRGRKQHVVDADDALVVELDVVQERRAAMEREVQRVVEVVIEVRARADDKVHEPTVHQLHDAPAQARRRECAGHRQPDRGVVLRQQHLVREDAARLANPGGVEGLKTFLYEMTDLGAALRPVVADGLAGQVLLAG